MDLKMKLEYSGKDHINQGYKTTISFTETDDAGTKGEKPQNTHMSGPSSLQSGQEMELLAD